MKTNNIRVAIYARVRSLCQWGEDLHAKKLGLDAQLKQCRKLCEKSGWEIVGEYTDFQIGKDTTQPAWEKLLKRSEQLADFDKVLTLEGSRITRKASQYLTWEEILEKHSVSIETTNPPSNYLRLLKNQWS